MTSAADVAPSPAPAAQQIPRTIVVGVKGDPTSARDFTSTLAELLSRIGVDVVIADMGTIASALGSSDVRTLARVKVDFADSAPVSVTVQDAWSGEVRLHRELAPASSRQIAIETAAHIVYTSVETLAKERARDQERAQSVVRPTTAGSVGPAPAEAAPVAIPAAAVVPASGAAAVTAGAAPTTGVQPRWGLEVAPFYALHPGTGSQSELNGGAGLAIGVAGRIGRLRPAAWFSAEYRLPFDVASVSAAPRAQATSLRVTPVVNVATWSITTVQLGVVGGLDIINLDSKIPPIANQRVIEGLVGGAVLVRARVAPNAQCFLAGWYEYDLSRKSFQFGPTMQAPGPGPALPPPGTQTFPALPAWHSSVMLGIALSFPGG